MINTIWMWRTADGKDRDLNRQVPRLPEIGHRVVVPDENESKTVLTIEWDVRQTEVVVYLILN